MSWLFGGSGGDDNDDNDNDDYYDDNNDYDDNDDDDVRTRVIADFDPKPLQEGVKALKEIDKSANSKDVLRMVIQTERRKEAEARLREQQMVESNLRYREQVMQQEHKRKQEQSQLEHKQWEERLQRESQQKKELHRQQLQERARQQEEFLKKQEAQNEKNLARQKQNAREIEEEKKRTLEFKAKLDQDTARIQAKAQTEGRIEQERVNEDVHLRSQREKLEEDRKTRLEIRMKELEAYTQMFTSIKDVLTDKDKLFLLCGAFAFLYASKTGIKITGNQIEKRLGKPSLIRETSRTSYKDFMPNRNWFNFFNKNKFDESNDLKGIILEKGLNNKMKFITRGTRNTKKNNAPFRHLCIYGPPGTGKTLFAKSLARDSGLHYAIMTGGDFSQLGNNAVIELHKVFNWAESSKKGTILFIDEADAFLRKGREGDNMSESMRNALSAFLYRTGTETKDFMVCLATNVPEALDKAVLDRIDDVVEFGLPGEDERKKMLEYYFKVFITQEEEPTYSQKHMRGSFLSNDKMSPINCKGFENDESLFDRLAEKTDGFSGRQIAKYLIQVQATMFQSSDDLELTPFLMEQILETFLKTKAFGLE